MGTIVDCIILSNTKDEQIHQMTQTAIDTLIESDKDFLFRIIVVETQNSLINPYKNAYTIFPHEQFNYNKFLNIGLGFSTEDYVIIANNDLIFHDSWFSNIKSAMEENNLDSASPYCPGWQFHKDFKDGVFVGYDIGRELCGWCIVVKKETLDKIGKFDERLIFWCQDNLYAIRLQQNGLKHALVSNSHVTHLVSQSHRLIPHGQEIKFTSEMGNVLADILKEDSNG
jgi:hypothetical protein